ALRLGRTPRPAIRGRGPPSSPLPDMGAAMMSLREYRSKAAHLADFLPWAASVGEGVVLNKDGSFQRTARFRGPGLDSATPAELVAVTARLNNSLRRLGSSWAIFVEAQRTPALDYPEATFP